MPPAVAKVKQLSPAVTGGELSEAEASYMSSGGDGSIPGGGEGGETQAGDQGSDTFAGGQGADTLQVGGAADSVAGGAGADTVSYELPEHLKGKFVPHEAMHEERTKRKAGDDENKALKDQNAILVDRAGKLLQVISESIQPGAAVSVGGAAAPVEPDIEKDPMGWIAFNMKGMQATIQAQAQEIAGLKTGFDGAKTQTDQERAFGRLAATASNLENEFKAKTPDYSNATNFLAMKRHEQLTLMGVTDPQERHKQIMNEAWVVAAQAIQAGKNPSEIMYQMAKTVGYVPIAGGATQAGGQGADTVVGGAGDDTAAAHLAGVQKGQDANLSLSNGRGSGASPISVQKMIDMSDADFAKTYLTPRGRELMGA